MTEAADPKILNIGSLTEVAQFLTAMTFYSLVFVVTFSIPCPHLLTQLVVA